MSAITPDRVPESQGLFESKRGRVALENITAYLFLAPSMFIIFLFGIFPVAFAFFVSLHRWRRFPDEYEGLDSYVEALGNFAFVIFFWMALGLLFFAGRRLLHFIREAQDDRAGWLMLIPGAAMAAALLAFINWFFVLLPFVLDVPQRIRGQAIVEGLFVNEFIASFRFPEPLAAADVMWLTMLIAIVTVIAFVRLIPTRQTSVYLVSALVIVTAFASGILVMQLTISEINIAIAEAQADGESLPIWTQIIIISFGAMLLFVAYRLWQRASRADSDRAFILQLVAATLLVVAAYTFITQLPPMLADADDDVFQAFNVTVMYSAFSVPIQLTLGLGLAVLLFQNIRGKAFFRVVYFMPYITPFVATSVIFALLFSHRSGSPINQLFTNLGLETQNWLLEPRGIFQLSLPPSVFEWLEMNISTGVANWLVGPGLALVVVIIYSIWTYAGYSTVIFLAGLGNIPGDLYEAARIDGASSWAQFRHITFPLLSPTTFFLVLIATIGTFQAFTQIFLLRRPGAFDAVDTVNILIYEEIRDNNPDYAYGSAMAFVLFAVILILTLVQNRVAGRRVFYG